MALPPGPPSGVHGHHAAADLLGEITTSAASSRGQGRLGVPPAGSGPPGGHSTGQEQGALTARSQISSAARSYFAFSREGQLSLERASNDQDPFTSTRIAAPHRTARRWSGQKPEISPDMPSRFRKPYHTARPIAPRRRQRGKLPSSQGKAHGRQHNGGKYIAAPGGAHGGILAGAHGPQAQHRQPCAGPGGRRDQQQRQTMRSPPTGTGSTGPWPAAPCRSPRRPRSGNPSVFAGVSAGPGGSAPRRTRPCIRQVHEPRDQPRHGGAHRRPPAPACPQQQPTHNGPYAADQQGPRGMHTSIFCRAPSLHIFLGQGMARNIPRP